MTLRPRLLLVATAVLACSSAAAAQSPPGEERLPPWRRSGDSAPESPARALDWYDMAGLDASQWKAFRDGEPWTDDLQEPLAKVLFRLPQIERSDLDRWRREQPLTEFLDRPAEHRLDVLPIRGRLQRVERLPFLRELAVNFDLPAYCRAEVRGPDGRLFLVLLREVPQVWLEAEQPLDEPVAGDGLFLQAIEDAETGELGVAVAAQRLHWLPTTPRPELGVTDSIVRLAELGVDASLLQDVRARNRKGLNELDREPFYQWLRAATRAAEAAQPTPQALNLADVLSRSQEHHGRYVRFPFNIRRVTRVVVEEPDIQQRFGLRQYFQLDGFVPLDDLVIRLGADAEHPAAVFHDRFPASVVVASLPPSIAAEARDVAAGTGRAQSLNRNVMVDGLFFKIWSYKTEFIQQHNPNQLQISPMFMAARVQTLESRRRSNPWLGAIAGGLFLAAAAAVWIAMWRSEQSSRRRR